MNMHSEIPQADRPISEEYRIVAKAWIDADAGARLREEMKTPTLERLKGEVIKANPKLADNAAEREVKSSEDWHDYIRGMVDARTAASRFKAQLNYIEMKFKERQSLNATAREEMRMGSGR